MTRTQKVILLCIAILVGVALCLPMIQEFLHQAPAKTEKEIAHDSATYYHDRYLKIEEERRIYEQKEQYHQANYKRLEDSINVANNSQWLQFKRDSNRAVIDSANAKAVRNGTRR